MHVQEVCQLHELLERCENFKYGILQEMQKLMVLKSQEQVLGQRGSMLVVQDKGKRRARELESEEDTMV